MLAFYELMLSSHAAVLTVDLSTWTLIINLVAHKEQVKHNKEKIEDHLSLMKSKYLHTTNKLEDAEKVIDELQQKTEDTTNKLANEEKRLKKWKCKCYTATEDKVDRRHDVQSSNMYSSGTQHLQRKFSHSTVRCQYSFENVRIF